MTIDTAKVQGRRELHFNSIDDILADLERLNQGKIKTLGNWSSGQVLKHLSVPIDWCLDGAKVRAPFYIRIFGWMMKNRFLRNAIAAGFALPATAAEHLVPPATSWDDGLRIFRASIQRLKSESQRHPSPFLGAMTREQWDQLHCRHAELHLSFLVVESSNS